MKRVIALLVAFLLGGVYLLRADIAALVYERALAKRLAPAPPPNLELLQVILCGAGGPLPDPVRSGPCVLVVAGDTQLVIDAGTGGGRNIGALGFDAGRTDAVLLTHFHSDHLDGLGELAMLRWVTAAHRKPLPVYGTPGVTSIVDGFNQVYELDAQYRNAHHGDGVAPLSGAGMVPREFAAPAFGTLVRVFEQDGLTVDALRVEHEPVEMAVAYLISYGDRRVLVSGDTRLSENLARFSQGVDLLVHEALSKPMVAMMQSVAETAGNDILARVTTDIPDYHVDPQEVAALARDAQVKHLLFYHIVPATPLPGLDQFWLKGVADIFPNHTLGVDGTRVELPLGSSDLRVYP